MKKIVIAGAGAYFFAPAILEDLFIRFRMEAEYWMVDADLDMAELSARGAQALARAFGVQARFYYTTQLQKATFSADAVILCSDFLDEEAWKKDFEALDEVGLGKHHQCSKLPREQWDIYLRWLFDFEYRLMGIPAPDAVIYLSVEPTVSQSLMTGRYQGDESRKDIHEGNLGYLRRSREAAEYCTEKLGWRKIECCRDGTMRPIEDIQEEILGLI